MIFDDMLKYIMPPNNLNHDWNESVYSDEKTCLKCGMCIRISYITFSWIRSNYIPMLSYGGEQQTGIVNCDEYLL